MRRTRALAAVVALAAGVVVAIVGPTAPVAGAAGSPCGATVNPIVCENQQPGTPPSVWDIDGAGDDDIQGFSTDVSVNVGSPVSFKINTTARAYTIDIYRLGYYQGNGARKIGSVTPSAPLPQSQPTCLSDASTQLVDCGNWAVSASWNVPSTAVSGVYLAKLTRPDNGDTSQITFIVRNDASTSDIVYQTSDPTWEAYNVWGGNDFYTGNQALTNSQARAFKVSYNRPYATRGSSGGRDFLFSNEYPTLRFLERNGYDMSYIAGVDTDRAGALLRNHKVFFSVGHDEYWSQAQRTNVEAARDAGVNLVFLSGNEVYWRTRYEPSIDGSNTPYRTLVSYKETWDDAPTDPVAPSSTSTFRDPRFATGVNGGNPENGLTGTLYQSNNTDLPIQVSGAEGKYRLWRGTSLGSVADTAVTALAPHTVGYESDEDLDNGFRPAGLIDLSTTVGSTPQYLQDFGSVTKPGTTTHHLTLYRAASGALVFGAGTVQWGWGLDQYHDGANPAPADSRMQQATVNLLADMTVQPATLMTGLVAASASTDTTGPTVTVTSPAGGTALAQGAAITVTGTATDTGGGRVAGVEVSTDAGVSWHPATGTTSWSYSGFVRGIGTGTILARATDDSANTGAVATPAGTSSCPCTLFGAQTPVAATDVDGGDSGGAEVGTRFTADRSGYVTGIRFYKATANTGTHTGTLWAPDGSVLASGDFTGETASGWQTLTFAQNVAVTAGTVYTVSYFAPSGHYSATGSFFYYRDFSAAPLHAAPFSPADPNAVASVYAGRHQFPTSTYKSMPNYWVDPVFSLTSTTPPAVTSVSPRNGATGVTANSSPVTVTFGADVAPGQLSVTVSSGSGQVAGTVGYDAPSRTATFTPSQPWLAATTYTVSISATGTNGVGMAAPVTTTFATTVTDGRCPCTLVDTSTSVPTTASVSETRSVEVGVKFTADTDGVVLGVQFYKGPQNIGTHVGSVWAPDGTLLASATFANESAQGWQYVAFSSPVPVTAGTTYTASYRASAGRYAATSNVHTVPRDRFPLHVPTNGAVYTYGTGAPTTTSTADYGVDVLFTVPSSVVPTPVASTPTPSATGVSTTSSVVATYNTSVTAGSPTFTVTDAGGGVVAGTTSVDAVQRSVTFTPSTVLAQGTVYTVSLSGGLSLGGVGQASALTWSFTTAGAGPSVAGPAAGTGLFAPVAAPATADSGDATAVSVGVKFTANAAGSVTGVRFYKAAANTGTHTVSLWATAAGTRLATATATAETASGWQTVAFASPVALTPGTTYTVSYYAPRGHYSSTSGYFAAPVTRGPLTAPVGAGVYVYRTDGLPVTAYQNANYWVDPLFLLANPPAPTVTARSPLPGATSVATSAAITATFSDDLTPSSVSASVTSTVGSGSATPVTVSTGYDAPTKTVTITPTGPLPRGATVTVSVSATGTNGGAMSSPDTWSFVTAQPSPTPGVCPCSLWDDAATPASITSTDTRAVELGVQFKADVAGTVSGVRFYKGPKNTGTHTVYLTTTTGTRLATATATAESSTGWQTVTFAQPVTIAANTLYLVSYFAPVGGYSVNAGQFQTTGLDVAPLHVVARGPSRYVYRAAGDTTVPTATSDANYWVSPVFSPNG